MSDQVKFRAVVYWASLHQKNELADAYQVVLGQLSDAAVEALEALDISVQDASDAMKEDEDGNSVPDEAKREQGRYITCKSKQYTIKAYDDDGIAIPEDVKVGNGSKAKAIVEPYEWKFKNKKGVSPTLKRLVITDLVEFSADNVGIDDDDVL